MTTLYLDDKESAKLARRILKASFPATKFSVTIGRGAGVSSVHVRWTDGPSARAVESLVGFIEAGRFDGMTDSYDYDRSRVIDVDGVLYRPGCKYLFTKREISANFARRLVDAVAAFWGGVEYKPVVIDGAFGFAFVDGADYRRNVRGDLRVDWSEAIHTAAADRQSVTRDAAAV